MRISFKSGMDRPRTSSPVLGSPRYKPLLVTNITMGASFGEKNPLKKNVMVSQKNKRFPIFSPKVLVRDGGSGTAFNSTEEPSVDPTEGRSPMELCSD
mmetsp:Transcript_46234/g.53558  ORF Transcript_46234/g.53558 Transcript_46234/m.53558 type:complete len:98 (-) Transcript_46234:298-591(-)